MFVELGRCEVGRIFVEGKFYITPHLISAAAVGCMAFYNVAGAAFGAYDLLERFDCRLALGFLFGRFLALFSFRRLFGIRIR